LWLASKSILDDICRMHTSGVTTGNAENIANYYNLLEVTDKDCQCVSPALPD
jgi:hypothetical protein